MKKSILKFSVIAIIGTFTLVACGGEKNHEEATETSTDEISATIYACPMKCEGEKTYTEAGSCPKCGMDLTIVAE